jgi:cyclic-di-GMP-binding biofilm dispersal mediator protein
MTPDAAPHPTPDTTSRPTPPDRPVVAVVGGTGGLGRALVVELERRGTTVVALSRTTEPSIDVRDHRAGEVLVDHVVGLHGRLDTVIVASGIVAFGDLADTDDVIVEELLLTNALGPLWLAKRCLPALAATNGCFVAISGVVAETPQAGMAAYSSSKAALSAGLTAIRREFRRQGVTVLDVRPPHTETGLASRPIAGTSPRLPTGIDPATVASMIADAVTLRRDELPSSAFG